MTETVTEPTAAPQQVGGYEDYWGTAATVQWFLPDKKQYFTIQPMTEGARARFQKLTNRDIVMSQRAQGEARIAVDPAGERHALIKESVVGWLLYKDGTEILFSKQMLEKWLDVTSPHLVEKLEHAIRKANPWLQAEMTVEMIDEEIERLYELRKQKVEEEAGEGDSANK